MNSERFNRQISFFGIDGQKKLEAITVVVVGIGGLGTHVIQQLTYLGVNDFFLIDDEEIEVTNLNRYVGTKHDDVGKRKTKVGKRIIEIINPNASVEAIQKPLQSKMAFDAIISSDCVFGCLDNDGARLILNELCSAYEHPYFDLASEILPQEKAYGGRVFSSIDEQGCLVCYDQLDLDAASLDLENPETRKDREDIYGLNKVEFHETGPSVVSINGIIASLAVIEFLVWATALRKPQKILTYRGNQSIVTINNKREIFDCYYCNVIRGKKDQSGVFEYIQGPSLYD